MNKVVYSAVAIWHCVITHSVVGHYSVKANVREKGYETDIEDLQMGINNFDSIVSALLTCFQALTLEGWTITMYSGRFFYYVGVERSDFMWLPGEAFFYCA